MKVTKEQAAANRNRVVDAAGRLFRERGFEGVGVADIMKAAGLTHGGFYGQFGSKDDLTVEACARVLDRSNEFWRNRAAEGGRSPLKALIDPYLSARHRDHAGDGCLYAALAAEIGRQDNKALRRAVTEKLKAAVDIVAGVLPGRAKAARRKRALATLSAMIGALILARAVDDEKLSDEILAATRAALTARGGT